MAKAIFISGDGWLAVFDLLAPSQLGLGISMISHRFDCYVDEHFKTRKWTLRNIRIGRRIGENVTNEMEIVNLDGKELPIPQMQLPRKVIGFRRIDISYIDRDVITFLHRFGQLFASCPINLAFGTNTYRILEFVLPNIWPMFEKNICALGLYANDFDRLRQCVPSFLNDCPSLRFVSLYFGDLFTEFPADNCAMASDGQALAKWLFTAHPNNVPKMFKCYLDIDDGNWSSRVEALKAAFSDASSPAAFIVVVWFRSSYFADSILAFDQTNEFTREQLALKSTDYPRRFLLIRCPIERDASEWAKWEEEALVWEINTQWNRIGIQIFVADGIGEGLLNATPGPSDH
ncbi:hypothetical protein niasHT_029883 [Heterodera trifolii]|uniref:Uncharacterized protein n=1 Tax=Heterodera trifolii TaxID=157864 RepID=A0ABD2KBC8_9BILA